jgi:two-component system response regulator TrcR
VSRQRESQQLLLIDVIMAGVTIPPKRILVVDDEPAVAETIRMVLAISGHKVEVAGSAEEALGRFAAGKYDLVVTDLSLPKMDGLDFARAVKEQSPGQPIILITAYAESMGAETKRLANVDFLMGKPFSLQQLQEALHKIFPPA